MKHQSILDSFAAAAEEKQLRMHGCVLMQNGRITARHDWASYSEEKLHRMYSASKSFVAIAIGKLVGEQKLSLDDKIIDFFKDEFDLSQVHPYLKETTVRNLLMMATPFSKSTYGAQNKDWLHSYFTAQPDHPANTVWHYDSCGSYVLGAIVKRVSGMYFDEYLRPEFDTMGMSKGIECLKGPDGEAWAGSALLATTGDLAKAAYLLLNKGKWGDKQLLPSEYVKQATSALIWNNDNAGDLYMNCGYGYQIWILPHGAFAFKGMGGQLAIGFPGRDLVFACTADTQGNMSTYETIWLLLENTILPHFPILDQQEYEAAQPKQPTTTWTNKISGKTYELNSNPTGITSFSITADEKNGCLTYERNGETKQLSFGVAEEEYTLFPEKYSGRRLFDPDTFMNYACSVKGTWVESHKLLIRARAEDIYVGNMSMCFSFRDDLVGIKMCRSAQFFFDDFQGFAGGRLKTENNKGEKQ